MPKQGAGLTLVEFYDAEHLENVISLLYEKYDAVTYVYFKRANEPNERDRETLERFLREKFGIAPDFLEVPENTIDCALRQFEAMTAAGGFYEFDITGGSSVFIAAVGALLEREGGRRIALHEYEPLSGTCVFRAPPNAAAPLREHPASLTFTDLLTLRGIDRVEPESPIRYDLKKDDLRGEILRLWETVRGELSAWNTLNTRPTNYTSGWTSVIVEKQMDSWQYVAVEPLLKRLTGSGIFSQLHKRGQGKKMSVYYRLNVPETARFLYDKSGNILELLTYPAAEESGEFADQCTGVKLDWEERVVTTADPYNEIDAILVKGHIPFFVSCKNAVVKNDYLYEIVTMTRHFGGKYAVPALVSTMDCGAAVRTRAKEMGVVLIDDVGSMTAKEFRDRLCGALRSR